ncbi:FtsK/SpoIIIE domain-containing protein [Microterricola pindariensis]|uniref:FtsK domain-containing protein n=1 Tax=Microterricola pindariensis TaxID=478010 RepID=A0ABX5AY98_9MICO|nr:FtsK/SpoIIIE domain-containing protein [Microterricola pindariensis]PPL19339.1 hypothetical protein GY24_06485 [Microterricola pindariensis]
MSPSSPMRQGPSSGTLTAPALPQRPARTPFPLVASVAPVVAAGGIWLLTHSPFVLLFALLGPVVAVAGMLDGRRQGRRALRRARARFDSELAELDGQLAARHDEERRAARLLTPSALDIAAGEEDAGRWQGRGPGLVTLGSGPMPSSVRLDPAPAGGAAGDLDPAGWAALGALREICDRAETVQDAPVTEPLAGGIGVVGPAALARPVLRGLLLQFLRSAHPGSVSLQLPPGAEWQWAAALPHCRVAAPGGAGLLLVDRAGGVDGAEPAVPAHGGEASSGGSPPHLLAVADSIEELPTGCQSILRVESARSALLLRTGGGAIGTRLVPELLGRQQAAVAAGRLARAAGSAGVAPVEARLPDLVRLHDLERFGRRGAGLSCVLGVAQRGPIELDLVANGPHALVGGTTGSGKSELLVSWVLSLAAAYPPSALSVLLVDFKGGSAFGELARLPHCVGVLTDLEEAEAARALASLQAELRHRERTLRAVRAREIDDPAVRGQLPRLVIVVDEFAAMLGSAPDLHAVFVDIAARGRSLGMHLILCTQRPAGVLRDALLANCTLRISLRVNNRDDSRATIGTDSAALLPPGKPGRAIVAAGDGRLIEFQSAISEREELERAVGTALDAAVGGSADGPGSAGAGGAAGAGVRRPWLPPLPDALNLTEVPAALLGAESGPVAGTAAGTAFTLGIVDEPERQRRRPALWAPAEHGPLLVLGVARSGRSSVLWALAEQASAVGWAVQRCGTEDPEGYWDALISATEPWPSAGAKRLLLLDDWDAVLARWPAEYQAEAGEMLGIALREGARTGRSIALASRGVSGALQTHRALFDATVLLRQAERGEHLRAGGKAATWRESAPAGRGEWRGLELQCAGPGESGAAAEARPDEPLELGQELLLVVSSAPARVLPALRALVASAGPTGARSVGGGLGAGDGAGDGPWDGPWDGSAGSVVELGELDLLAAGPGEGVRVIVGDPDAWQARWGLFAGLRPRARLLFHECRLADFRTLARLRELPPLLARRDGALRAILIDPEGRAQRVRIG